MGFTTKVRMAHVAVSNYSTEMQSCKPTTNSDPTIQLATAKSRHTKSGIGQHRVGFGQFLTQCPRCGSALTLPVIERLYSSTPGAVGGFSCTNTACRYLQPLFLEVAPTKSSVVSYKEYQHFQESLRQARVSLTSELKERMDNRDWRMKMYTTALPSLENGNHHFYIEESVEFVHWKNNGEVSVDTLGQDATTLTVVWPIIATLRQSTDPMTTSVVTFSTRIPQIDGQAVLLSYDQRMSY